MSLIKNVKTINGEIQTISITDGSESIIDGSNLTILPALIDPHVHFRTPGQEHKEDWQTGSQAALNGGVTTVIDMPNNNPTIIDRVSLHTKKELIEQQLNTVGIPLHYYLHLGATPTNHTEYAELQNEIVGIKIFMGSSTGELLVAKKDEQAKIFKTAAELGLVVAVHAEDEEIIQAKTTEFTNPTVADHSKIRDRQAAIKAVTQAIELAKEYSTKLYICHVSTVEEIDLIKKAKADGIKVYAEATPHHLFLDENDYTKLGTKAQMNPPLRTKADQTALWQAIDEGIIDTIGTDHAPHTLEEKSKPYGHAPSGVPNIETYLPLLLDTHNQGKISLKKIVELTRTNIQTIFNLPDNNDKVLVDLNLDKEVKNANLKTKCGWSPFAGRVLKGWPIITILNNKIYNLN